MRWSGAVTAHPSQNWQTGLDGRVPVVESTYCSRSTVAFTHPLTGMSVRRKGLLGRVGRLEGSRSRVTVSCPVSGHTTVRVVASPSPSLLSAVISLRGWWVPLAVV